MSCENCTQQIKEQVEKREKLLDDAKKEAKQKGEWIAICVGGYSKPASQLVPGEDFVQEYISQ